MDITAHQQQEEESQTVDVLLTKAATSVQSPQEANVKGDAVTVTLALMSLSTVG